MRPAKTATDLRYGRRGGNWQVDQRQTVPKCEVRAHWWRLNDLIGCIHPNHGDYPPRAAEARAVVLCRAAAIADEMELDLTGPTAAPFSRCSREPAPTIPASGRSDSPPQGSPGPVGDPT